MPFRKKSWSEYQLVVYSIVVMGPTMAVVTEPTAFQRFQILDAPVFTNEGFIMALLLVAVPFLMVLRQHVTRVKPS